MSWPNTLLPALLTGIVFSAALAPNAKAQVPVRSVPSTAPGAAKRPRQEPCWQVAGISRSALQERRAIAQQARQEVESVCANSSLSLQQKRQQIEQIHQRERQQIDGIITPAQQEALRSCQEARNGGGHAGGHGGGGHGGPCGEMSVGHKPHPMEEDEMPPNETPKPN